MNYLIKILNYLKKERKPNKKIRKVKYVMPDDDDYIYDENDYIGGNDIDEDDEMISNKKYSDNENEPEQQKRKA